MLNYQRVIIPYHPSHPSQNPRKFVPNWGAQFSHQENGNQVTQVNGSDPLATLQEDGLQKVMTRVMTCEPCT